MPTSTFVGGLLVGTVLFVGFHTLLGFLAGPGVGAALSAINIPVWLLVIVLVVLGLVGWIWLRARARRKAAAADDEPGAVFDWADACCPACLAAARLAEGLQKTQSMPRPA
jgi:amino acid transporter